MIPDASFGVIPFKQINGVWHVLLICHQAGHWGFPKGHPEKGESPMQAAERELFEETGLKIVKWISSDPISEHYEFTHNQKRYKKEVQYFMAEVSGEVAIQNDELKDSLWATPEQAEERITFPEGRAVLKQAYRIFSKDHLQQ